VQIQRFKNKLVGNELFTGIRVNGKYYPEGFTSSITKSAFKVNDDHYRLIDFTESYVEVKALLEVPESSGGGAGVQVIALPTA